MVIFVILAAFALLGSLGLVLFKKTIYSALSLIFTMTCLAGIYALQGAHFLALTQIAVYAGAIMVLVLFVIMLLNIGHETGKRNILLWLGVFFISGIFLLKLSPLFLLQGSGVFDVRVEDFGNLIFGKYLFVFELTSLLILSALVSAVLIARKSDD